MKIGFTGSREGMTSEQRQWFAFLLTTHMVTLGGPMEFHHGDCVGADDQAAYFAYTHGYRIIAHPPVIWTHNASLVTQGPAGPQGPAGSDAPAQLPASFTLHVPGIGTTTCTDPDGKTANCSAPVPDPAPVTP